MTYATLMVHVDDTDEASARVAFACDLADVFGATLIGVAGCRPEQPLVDTMAVGAMAGELLTLERDVATTQVRSAEARFRAVAEMRQRPIEWRAELDVPADVIERESRAADLILLGRDGGPSVPNRGADPGDVLLSAGRPVLIVPPGARRDTVASRVIVAWKETRESRRAIVDALPFLRTAAEVTVVEICEDGELIDARRATQDVVAFLARHSVEATSVTLGKADRSVAERLIDIARDRDAGLIVMGGYGHARMREWALGGVTREILRTTPVCCLISH